MSDFLLSKADIARFTQAIDERLPELQPYDHEVDWDFLEAILSKDELAELAVQSRREELGAVRQYRVGAALVTLSHMVQAEGVDTYTAESVTVTLLSNGKREVVCNKYSAGSEPPTHILRLNPPHPSTTSFEEIIAVSQEAAASGELSRALGMEEFYSSDLPGILAIIEQCTEENRVKDPED